MPLVFSIRNAFHFIQGHLFIAPIVELGGAGRGMASHVLGLFSAAPVLQICRDASSSERVTARIKRNAGRPIARCTRVITRRMTAVS